MSSFNSSRKPVPGRIVPAPPKGWASWEDLMDLALAEALKAEALGEVPVGALVVSAEGMVISKAHNCPVFENDPTAHAEIRALRKAGEVLGNYRLGNAFLVVTLEPCLMCTGALVHSRVAGVVYGAPDIKMGAVDSCLDGLDLFFNNHSPWRLGGVREEECAGLLRNFFETLRK